MTTALLAPLVAGGRVVGSLAFGRGPSGRRFDPDDLDVAVDLGRRIGLAWHNAVLLPSGRRSSSSLHDGLMVSDGDGVVLEVNERWCELAGLHRGGVASAPACRIRGGPIDDVDLETATKAVLRWRSEHEARREPHAAPARRRLDVPVRRVGRARRRPRRPASSGPSSPASRT